MKVVGLVFYTSVVLVLQFFAFPSKLVLLQMLLSLAQSRVDLWAFLLWISLFAFTSQIFKYYLQADSSCFDGDCFLHGI